MNARIRGSILLWISALLVLTRGTLLAGPAPTAGVTLWCGGVYAGPGAAVQMLGSLTSTTGPVVFNVSGSGQSPTTATVTGGMVPGQTYAVSVLGTDVSEASLYGVAPPGYRLEIEDMIKNRHIVSIGGTGGFVALVRILPDDPTTSAGSASALIPGRINWRASLGALLDGSSAGEMLLTSTGQEPSSSAIASLSRLNYDPPSSEVDVFWVGGKLRQIVAPATVVDLVELTGYPAGFEVRFYHRLQAVGDLYPRTFTGLPFVTYQIAADGSDLKLTGTWRDITGLADTTAPISRQAFSRASAGVITDWALVGQTHLSEKRGTWNSLDGSHSVTTPTGTVVASKSSTYTTLPNGGSVVSQSIVGQAADASTETFQYHTNPAEPSYGKVSRIDRTDGSWTTRTYHSYTSGGFPGLLWKYEVPFQDGGTGEVVEATVGYAPDPWGQFTRKTLESRSYKGQNVGQTSITYTEAPGPLRHSVVTATTTERVNSTATLVSVSKYFRENVTDRFYRRKPHASRRSDGTVSAYVHQRGTWNLGSFAADGSANGARHATLHGLASAPAQGGSAFLATYEGYDIEDLYVVPGKSTLEQVFRDRFGRVVRTEARVWSGTTWEIVDASDFTYDLCHRLIQSQTLRGELYTAVWSGPLRLSEVDPDGTSVNYTYDTAGRVLTATRAGSGETSPMAITYAYDAADRLLSETFGPTADGTLASARTYDTAGRTLSVNRPDGTGSTTAYDLANRRTTTTSLGGATTIETRYLDGRVKSVTGTAVVPSFYTYTASSETLSTKVMLGSDGSPRWKRTATDLIGRTLSVETPGFGPSGWGTRIETFHYATSGSPKVRRISRNDGTVSTLFSYDEFGNVIAEGLDLDGNLQLDPGGADRISLTDRRITQSNGAWWIVTRKETYPKEGSYTKLLLGQSSVRLTGYTGELRAEELSLDVEGRITTTQMTVDRAARRRTVTRTSPGIGTATSVFQEGLVVSETTADGRVFTFGYDALNRLDEARDPRIGTTRATYVTNTIQLLRRNDPGNRLLVQYGYDTDGRPTTTWNAASQPSYLSYNARGQTLRHWGPSATPVEYGYNGYGDRETMTTFRTSDAAALGGGWPAVAGDTTTWTIDAATGLVHRKTDAAGRVTEYTYDLAGRVATRRSARNLVSTYTYTSAGEASRIAYSDTTPAVAYAYNRLGQPSVISDGAGSRQFAYEAARPWRLETERLDTAFFGGRSLRTLYESGDAVGRVRGFELSAASTVELSQGYGFGAGGRVASVQAAHRESGSLVSRTFQYGYLANSALVQSLSIEGAHPFTLNRRWAADRDLLTSIDTRWSAAMVADYDYGYDDAGRRTSRVQSGSAFADYGQPTFALFTYNTRSELTAAVDHLGGTITDTSKPLPGRRNEYAYDTIGNRTSSGRNGVAGTEEEYTSNTLNQIATRENHAVPFSGTAAPDALVKVAGRPVLAGRQGAYWYDETTVPNTSGSFRGTRYTMAKPAGQNVVRIDGRVVTLAQSLQSFTYDLDGNLTQDGIWTYNWDAEGRLVAMATMPTAVVAGFTELTLRFTYDHQGRRVRKEVFGEGSALVSRTVWIYDGWNMIAEYDQPAIGGTLTLKRSYAWGLDLLGSLRASGGVGALLQLRDYTENATYLAGYDGNGNLTTLQNAATGTLAATYEYGPFGEPIATSGAYSDKNPMRFSTKYTDDETGLVNFGRRYYDPRNGRFVGRDPIEEEGGLNLYGFVGNSPVNRWDYLGMFVVQEFSRGSDGGVRINLRLDDLGEEQVLEMSAEDYEIYTFALGFDFEGAFNNGTGFVDIERSILGTGLDGDQLADLADRTAFEQAVEQQRRADDAAAAALKRLPDPALVRRWFNAPNTGAANISRRSFSMLPLGGIRSLGSRTTGAQQVRALFLTFQ